MSLKFYLSVLTIMLIGALSGFCSISQRFVPAAQVATLTGSSALWQNPAGLKFFTGLESILAYLYEWDKPGNRHHVSAQMALNFYNFLSCGVGINSRVAISQQARAHLGTDLSGIMGFALGLGDKSSLGLSFMKSHSFLASKSSDTMVSFGFQSRLSPHVALGALYQETHDGYFKAPNMFLGFGIRPYKDFITLSFDGRFKPLGINFSDGFRFDPIFGLKTQSSGLSLSLQAEMPGIQGFDKIIYTLGLEFNFAHWGLSLASNINAAQSNYGLGTSLRVSSAEWDSIHKADNLWVKLDIDAQGSLQERKPNLARQLFSLELSPLSILATLKRLANDPQIAGVIIHINGFSFGDGRAQEWRNALLALRAAHKHVVVYLDNPSERDYYIATAASKIYMNKQATLSFRRFQTTLVYMADLLAKIGVKAEAISAGSYKTATRVFTNAHPHKEELEVYNNILNDFYENLLEVTSKVRNLSASKLRKIFDQGEITALEAQNLGLIDEAIFEDEIRASLEKALSAPVNLYANYLDRIKHNNTWRIAKKVAVIPIEGEITDGHVYPSLLPIFGLKTGALDVIDEIDKALKDPRVIGIILRINSPGGLSSAGEKIQRAVVQAQEQIPVVSSMADVAASAGYLIASGSNHIIAERNTITGSIGVFSLHFSGEKLIKKIGLNTKELSPLKDPGPTAFRAMSSAEKAQAQKLVNWSYQNFITAVATGLELPEDAVRISADGRVWLGHEAFSRKLVQEIGGFAQALDAIRLLAKVPEPEELVLEIRSLNSGEIFSLGSRLASFFKNKSELNLGELATLSKPYIKAIDYYRLDGLPQARLPFNISWE